MGKNWPPKCFGRYAYFNNKYRHHKVVVIRETFQLISVPILNFTGTILNNILTSFQVSRWF